jgi:hypothetical protein
MSASRNPTGAVVTDPFESAWLKWAWAATNARVLADSIEGFASDFGNQELNYQLANYYDAKAHCIVLVVAEATDPFPALWGVLLGDTVHDYRCCLDHVAWALYKRGRTPDLGDKKERDIIFPIYSKRLAYNNDLDRRLPGVRRADRKIVRRYQPFAPGESRAHRHVFTVLQKLSNDDKHRVIQPVVAIPQRIDFTDTEAIDCIVRRIGPPRSFEGTVEPGAELARFYVKKTGPNPRIETRPNFHLVPSIHERLTLADFLEKTMGATRRLLREFAEPPPSAVALLGAPIPPR